MFERRSVTLGSVTQNFDARRRPVKMPDRSAGPYPYYGASGIVDSVDDFLFDGDYLLISEDGENLRTRTTPIAFMASGKFWVNNHTHVVQGNELASTKFLCHLLSITDVAGYLTGSTQPKFNRSALDSMTIVIPPLVVQEGIAEVLGALDDKIAANTRLAQAIEELLEVEIGQRWLGARDEVDDSKLVSISEFVEFNPLHKRPSEVSPVYVDMKKLPEVGSGIIDWDHRPAQGGARFGQGDTLLARITPCLQNRKTGFVDFLEPGQVAVGSTEFIVMRSRPSVAKSVSYFVAVNPDFRDFAIRHMVGTSGRQRVSSSDLALFQVPEPDLTWLRDFGARADAQFVFLKSLRDESRVLAATRDALLPQLMSGKLRVKDAEKSLAGVL